jgi:hypothetical protein
VNKIEKQDMRDRENESIFLLWLSGVWNTRGW